MAADTRGDVIARDIAEVVSRELPWQRFDGQHILVTGASGMIPSYVTRTLLALNRERRARVKVTAMVRDIDSARRRLADVIDDEALTLVEHDVSQPLDGDVRYDAIIHGASPARPAQHATHPIGTLKANLLGGFNLLDYCVRTDCRSFTLMSSAEVYGLAPTKDGLISEDSYGPVDPTLVRSCYPVGKRASETLAMCYAAETGIRPAIVRFGHIYGPGMPLDDGRVQAQFAADVMARRNIVLNSPGAAQRSYTYVADAVAGLFTVLLLGDGKPYNIADRGGLTTIRELAEVFISARPRYGLEVAFAEGVDPTIYSASGKQGLDSTRAEQLGWSPVVGLAEGVDRTLSWHEEAGERTSE